MAYHELIKSFDRIRDYNDKNYSSAPSLDEVESKAVEVSGTINTLLSKKDVIEKTRMVVYHSGFFDGLKDMKKIQVIAIEREDKLWISI